MKTILSLSVAFLLPRLLVACAWAPVNTANLGTSFAQITLEFDS
jgi:hypothetical protein